MFTFDLDKAVAAWRKSLRHNRAFLHDDVDELESHLRDHVDELVAEGIPAKQAFENALRRLGDTRRIEAEFGKVRWGRTRRTRSALKTFFWEGAILTNALKIAVRNLRRQRAYSLINIGGLALGLATCFVILLFVRYELSYDDFHTNADRIYRVLSYSSQGDNLFESLAHPAPLAPTLAREVPEIHAAVRVSTRYPEVLVKRDGEAFYENSFYFTDSLFFDVFDAPFVRGDARTALKRPYAVVISVSMAEKYFGGANPIGESLNIEGLWGPHDYEVTGVVRDFPPNSHFHFGVLTSMETLRAEMPNPEALESWRHVGHHTYVVVAEGVDHTALEESLRRVHSTHRGVPESDDGIEAGYRLQPLTAIHLYSNLEDELAPNGDVRYLYIFSALALLVLLVAGVNYVNLATARSARRAREVGIRKVVGAWRSQLVRQFLSEALVFGGISLLASMVLLLVFIPLFNRLSGKELPWEYVLSGEHLLGMAMAGVTVALLAGLYPAVFLSSFQPIRTLRAMLGLGPGSSRLRRGLVIAQFAISFGLIAGTLVIGRQLTFMQEKNLGLDQERVLVVNTHGALGRQFQSFRDELLKHSGIEHVTTSSPSLPAPRQMMEHWPEGFEDRSIHAGNLSVGPHFLETLKIDLLEGRRLPADYQPAEQEFTPVLINEAAAREFGWEQPLGKTFQCCFRPTPKVVGVVEDFHYRSVKEQIAPLVIMPTWWSRFVLVRIRGGEISESIAAVKEAWARFVPGAPFDYTFMDARFDATYESEKQLAGLFGAFSALGIIIASMGLFGLAAFMTETRTKEIGIRKVLGATIPGIVGLLSREFMLLVVVAILIGAPAVYLAAQYWLEDFAYRTPLSPAVFLWAGLTAVLVAMLTVFYQSVKAALINPSRSLRCE